VVVANYTNFFIIIAAEGIIKLYEEFIKSN